MNRQGMLDEKQSEARTTLGRRNLWILALTVLVMACLCMLMLTGTMSFGERDVVRGSGNVIAEDRSVGHFERISLGDLGTLIISQGDKDALTIETDDNLMRFIQSRVQGGTLVLGLSNRAKGRGVEPSEGLTYRLSLRQITGLEVEDSGRIRARALDVGHLEIVAHDSGNVVVDSLIADRLQVYIEDSGAVHLAGKVGDQEATVQDSGRYLAARLQSRAATVTVGDSAETTLWVMETLDVSASDSGCVRYYGDPRRTQRLSHNGTLTGLGEP